MNEPRPFSPVESIESISERMAASVILKLMIIGGLIIVLMLPTFMIMNLIGERKNRRDTVVAEVGSKWGLPQKLAGPILSIPYREQRLDAQKKPYYTYRTNHILPDELTVTGNLRPEIRYRGIYEVVVYTAGLTVKGSFRLPDAPQTVEQLGGEYLWDRMKLSLGIQDLRGIKERLAISWGTGQIPVEPGHDFPGAVLENGVHADVSWQPPTQGRDIPFSFALELKGSDAFLIQPAGKTTSVELTSTWGNPSFIGEFLPEDRTVSDGGFTARWKVFHFNRAIPQAWWDTGTELPDADFGVQMLLPLDEYQKNERTAKYAVLILALTFAAFFVTEAAGRQRVHPVQYLLIGLALCIFYVLLLSLSEQIGFGWSYLVSATAIVGLITWYARSAFTEMRFTLTIGGVLSALYGYLYFILQLEDYALLAGSIGLFVIMAVIMYFTRKIKWYERRLRETNVV